LPLAGWAQSGDLSAPKVIAENDKMRVTEAIGKPGEATPSIVRTGQLYYYVQGGTAELTYADGTKTTVERKTGQALIVTEKRAYSAKNIGKTTLRVLNITLK
jgi:mannose-6-phosphate isomerase-like protein (cupin superfamily)